MRPTLLNDLEEFLNTRGSYRVPVDQALSDEIREAVASTLLERKLTLGVMSRAINVDASGFGKFMREPHRSLSVGKAIDVVRYLAGSNVSNRSFGLDERCWRFLNTGEL